jgi:hypothetical protein
MTYKYKVPKDAVVISASCGSFKTHEPHVITKGFLGLGRRECEGYQHRHIWRLAPSHVDGRTRPFVSEVKWTCHCGDWCYVTKDELYDELTGGRSRWFESIFVIQSGPLMSSFLRSKRDR